MTDPAKMAEFEVALRRHGMQPLPERAEWDITPAVHANEESASALPYRECAEDHPQWLVSLAVLVCIVGALGVVAALLALSR